MAQRDPGAKHNAQLLASSLFLFLIKYVIFKKQEETNEENPKYMCVNLSIYIHIQWYIDTYDGKDCCSLFNVQGENQDTASS